MANKFPRYRVTIELLDCPPLMRDAKLGVYSFDRGRIIGDVWLNEVTATHSFVIATADFFVGVGHDAGNFRSAADAINFARGGK